MAGKSRPSKKENSSGLLLHERDMESGTVGTRSSLEQAEGARSNSGMMLATSGNVPTVATASDWRRTRKTTTSIRGSRDLAGSRQAYIPPESRSGDPETGHVDVIGNTTRCVTVAALRIPHSTTRANTSATANAASWNTGPQRARAQNSANQLTNQCGQLGSDKVGPLRWYYVLELSSWMPTEAEQPSCSHG